MQNGPKDSCQFCNKYGTPAVDYKCIPSLRFPHREGDGLKIECYKCDDKSQVFQKTATIKSGI